MQKSLLFALLFCLAKTTLAQTRIIDMHIHCYDSSELNTPSTDHYGNKGSAGANEHLLKTFEAFKKFNIVKAVVQATPTVSPHIVTLSHLRLSSKI